MPSKTYTVCFSGTDCTRDEGEETRYNEKKLVSDKRIYCKETGYIPVRIHKEISGELKPKPNVTYPSVTVRGVGENDWLEPRDNSEPLRFKDPLKAPDDLLSEVQKYSGGDQRSYIPKLSWEEVTGWAATALALHGANLAAASGAQQYNFIGHSRGAVEGIMAAWFLYAYGPRDIPINIFAIDPVPGKGNWYSILTQLPPNVANYVGVYAWDFCIQGDAYDSPYMALVPRPNGQMTGELKQGELGGKQGSSWASLADDEKCQLRDPLAPSNAPQPKGYNLYACRGRHSTVAGNSTSDSTYDPNKVSESVAPVPKLVYKLARTYLNNWGTTFSTECAVKETETQLSEKIRTDHKEFDDMGGGVPRTGNSLLYSRAWVRRVSSIWGRNAWNSYYMDDVVGDPPDKLVYPVSDQRENAGWVKWQFIGFPEK